LCRLFFDKSIFFYIYKAISISKKTFKKMNQLNEHTTGESVLGLPEGWGPTPDLFQDQVRARIENTPL
jgi:hypothetical protein